MWLEHSKRRKGRSEMSQEGRRRSTLSGLESLIRTSLLPLSEMESMGRFGQRRDVI